MRTSPMRDVAERLIDYGKSIGLSGAQTVIIFGSLIFALLLFNYRDWDRLPYFEKLWNVCFFIIVGLVILLGWIILFLER
jgi:hypothetical protein